MPVTSADARSTVATAFASCRATYAVEPAIATYSGSRLRLTRFAESGVAP